MDRGCRPLAGADCNKEEFKLIKLQCPVTVPSRVQIATEKQVDYLKQKMVTVPSRVQIATGPSIHMDRQRYVTVPSRVQIATV